MMNEPLLELNLAFMGFSTKPNIFYKSPIALQLIYQIEGHVKK